MTTAVRARTARQPHLCDSCHWTPSLRGVATIQPGHRYLLHTAFPGADYVTTDRPVTMKECVACACERDDSAGLLVAEACASFCHGTLPCALPLKHDGDHSCRRCAADRAQVVRPALTVADGS